MQIVHFGRPRQVNCMSSGVGDQPWEHGETPSLLKTAKNSHDRVLPLSPRLECSGTTSARCNPHLLDSKTGFRHIGQAGHELLISGDPPASASQNAEITGMSHCAQSQHFERPRRADSLSPAVRNQPGQHGKTLSLQKNTKISHVWWLTSVVPATQEAESSSS
ncbi:hypothetical protein AAY473_025914 [Plecturocebus cupreus]